MGRTGNNSQQGKTFCVGSIMYMVYAYLPVGIHTMSYMFFSLLEIKIKQFIH